MHFARAENGPCYGNCVAAFELESLDISEMGHQ